MNPFSGLIRELKYIRVMSATLKNLARIDPSSEFLFPDELEEVIDQHTNRTAFIEGDRSWTFGEFDAYANRIANWALSARLVPGDTLALFAQNRLEYVAVWFGLSKIGVRAALLNDLLSGKGLAHCLQVANSKAILFEPHLHQALQSAIMHLPKPIPLWSFDRSCEGSRDFGAAIAAASDIRPDRDLRTGIKARETLLKMFTSGTTGLPKSVKVSHVRAQRYANSFCAAMKTGPKDRMLMVLPMYHATGGLCGVGASLMKGGAVIIEKGFSASKFWKIACQSRATLFTYVGELCRFLVNTEPGEFDRRHSIRAMVGNGLRPEVWTEFQDRFKVKTIVEFYGSTEGNVGLMNADGKVGAMGRIPWYVKKSFNLELVAHDFETGEVVRNKNGHCIRVKTNQPGEAIGRIDPDDTRFLFEGYGNEKDTEKKILRDVFVKNDRYFRTGDLMRRDRHGYYYFVDRIGDTFRWMAQNVATGEVESVLGIFPKVLSANVYGVKVPKHDGRAGMAALAMETEFDGKALYAWLAQNLPNYAWPVFIRLVQNADTTGTFKFKKTDLIKDGFSPDAVTDPVFVLEKEQKTYVPLTTELHRDILAGSYRF